MEDVASWVIGGCVVLQNTIAFNTWAGVLVGNSPSDTATVGNRIRVNSIFSNGALGACTYPSAPQGKALPAELLPGEIHLVHGPGCPVCVIPMGRVDDAIAVAETPGVIFTSFGDMMRVPGGHGNLLEAKARGADVRFVYSPLDALALA
jgi:hypothetical protein